MWDWSVTLERDVPHLDRVEMDAPGARDFDFPVEVARVEVNGVVIPPLQREVSIKLVDDGALTIVNKTRRIWLANATLRAYAPVAP